MSSISYDESGAYIAHNLQMSVVIGKEIAEARRRKKLSQAALGKVFGVTREAVSQWESGKTPPGHKRWARLSQFLGIPLQLFYKELGGHPEITPEFPPAVEQDIVEIPPESVGIKEVEMAAGSGGGALEERFDQEAGPMWYFPPVWVSSELRARPAELRIITIRGDSMMSDPPGRRDLEPGDKIIVNISDRMPTPPGIFIVWDGLARVAKRVHFLPHSEPPAVRITSNNPEYAPYERTLEEAYIWGRVVGRWQRL